MPTDHPANTFYVSTPIYYVNDKPHVGHCYTTLLADALARAHRLLGKDVFFLTGTDEHADRVVTTGAEHGCTPIQWADRNAAEFQRAFELLKFSNDDFVRTTQDRHTSKVREFIGRLQTAGDVYLGDYEGWYDASQDEYLTETTARENKFLSPVTGKPLVRRRERNYFFRLSAYQDRLLKHIESNPGFIRPDARRNEVLGRIRQGLQDVPVSRAVDPEDPASQWGIRMPDDEQHRVYVWIDALFNYLSVIDTPQRRKYWPCNAHLIGKDILWFHAVIWPAMLMSLGEPLPKSIVAHSWWVREGRKMSKSLGNFLDLPTLLAYADAYSLDSLRWFLLTQGPQGATDADFAHARFIETINADLANALGNAASRVANMIDKYFEGKAPDPRGVTTFSDHDWPALARSAVETSLSRLREYDLAGAFQAAIALIRRVDGYINATEPFKIAKDPARRDDLAVILYHCAQAIRIAGALLSPAMPDKMDALLRRYAADPDDNFEHLTTWGSLQPGSPIAKGDPLFPRADPDAPAPVTVPAAQPGPAA